MNPTRARARRQADARPDEPLAPHPSSPSTASDDHPRAQTRGAIFMLGGSPRRLTVFLSRETAQTVHGLLQAELERQATLSGMHPSVWAQASDQANDLAMTHHLIGAWLSSLEESEAAADD